MKNWFRRKEIKFEYLDNYNFKDKYLTRNLAWDWLNEDKIHLFDNNAPRLITLDPWFQQIYLDADSQKTIEEYILWMSKQYRFGKTPENLDKLMLDFIDIMVFKDKIISMKDEKTDLIYYLDLPKSEQDMEITKQMMILNE